jgi:hypothetical protein
VKRWNATFIRNGIIGDDVYRPHTFEEISTLVSGEVASRLDPHKSYGIWWFNRRRSKTTQVSVPDGYGGRRYKQRVIDFWVVFSDVVIVVRRLIREGWRRYRWETRPSRRP